MRKLSPAALAKPGGRAPALSPAARARLRAGVLLALALAMGRLAQLQSESDAWAAWEAAHQPTPEVWDGIARIRGFAKVDDPDARHRIIRGLTPNADGPGSVWVSGDAGALVRLASAEEDLPAVYARPAALAPVGAGRRKGAKGRVATPAEWTRLGAGWTAVGEVLRLPKAPDIPTPTDATRERGDPREIRF